MHNEVCVIGRVTGIVDDKQAKLLLVEDNSNPKYPTTAACRFFGSKALAALDGIRSGDLVRVRGSIKSREHQGRWYTEFSAWSVQKLESGALKSGGARADAPPPADDDSTLPF